MVGHRSPQDLLPNIGFDTAENGPSKAEKQKNYIHALLRPERPTVLRHLSWLREVPPLSQCQRSSVRYVGARVPHCQLPYRAT